MANLINLENVSKSFGLKTLLDKVSLGVQTGDRIGVVGLNGGGKTTLLEILTGIEEPDEGRVSHLNDLRMAVVTQRAELDPELTIAQVVVEPLGLETFEWASNPKVRKVLAGLGIHDLDKKVGNLSGGERRRVNLAAALVRDLDLIVLDEPTNHLDVEGVQWLAEYLLESKMALVVVTHDRWFLDTVATLTWEVHDGTVDIFEGGYNDWTFARAERDRQASAEWQRKQNLARKELAWLRRGAPARTSKPRYRVEAAEALIADVPAPRDSVELMAFSKQRLGKKVIDLIDSTITTPNDRVLVEDLTWLIGPGDRIGIVGVNGSGKTTLMGVIAGDYPLAAGRRSQGSTVRIGWLRQELDDLDPNLRLLEAVQEVASYVEFGKKQLSASQLAERLGFSPKRQKTPVGDLSGGERRRLQLTRILMAEPNVLLLDEPTNDLDIDTLQELESLLDEWAGTLIVISHDRYMIERICDSTWALFGDKQLTNLPGGIEQYLQRRKQLEAVANVEEAAAPAEQSAKKEDSGLSGAELRKKEKELAAFERKMEKLNTEIAKVDEEMAAKSTDTDAVAKLFSKRQELADELAEVEAQWMEIAELFD
ncbi:MAG: ABC-F family ATP-binding cassette domain-containing protein [Corynebacterium sp.]|nr:ABC-F family ATP-binding cassette domain-containing protein [Corynebacterium sp.]